MAEETYKYLPVHEDSNEFNFRVTLDKYIRFWPWFTASVIILLALAVAYVKYAPKYYTSTASIIVKEEESAGNSSAASGFDVNLFSGISANSMANELGLLTSKRLMLNAVKALDLNVQYTDDSNFIEQPLYENSPIKIKILRLNQKKLQQAIINKNARFRVKDLGSGNLQFINESSGKIIETSFDTPLKLDFADFVITRNTNEEQLNTNWSEVVVNFSTAEGITANYVNALKVVLLDDNSTLIQLQLKDRVPKKSEDILNQLIFEYNKEAIEDKNLIAKNTADFIDGRLSIINRELDSVESGKESFKETNRLTNIGAESNMMIQNISEYNQQRQQVGTQLDVTESMLDYIDSESSNLLPTNLGLESSSSGIVDNYNSLVLERNRLAAGSTEKNPLVIRLDQQIGQLKGEVRKSLETQRQSLTINADNLRRRSMAIGSQISRVPGQERQVRGIERQQNIKESLYLYLLQKREENTLELSVTGPKAKIVDSAYSTGGTISPSPKIILGAALALGLLFPFMFIRGKELLNDKIKTREDLEKYLKNIPVVGELPSLGKRDILMIKENDRSVLSEAFRILSANMQYLALEHRKPNCGTSVFVTSSIKGEGKTFAANNLAITLALTGKKVILVGCDLRNPQLQRYHKNLTNSKGVSSYLVNYEQQLDSLFQESRVSKNLTILPAGSIPPNPAELLQSDRLGKMFRGARKRSFDYVVVDTAPSLLIADTFLINKYATFTLYVARSGYTKIKLMDFILDAKQNRKLKNLSIILNDVPLMNLGYGNKYGYGNDG